MQLYLVGLGHGRNADAERPPLPRVCPASIQSDNPFTAGVIEPSIPAIVATRLRNVGSGTSRAVFMVRRGACNPVGSLALLMLLLLPVLNHIGTSTSAPLHELLLRL